MSIIVRKPTEEENTNMRKQPTWGCDVSVFDWHYDDRERCILLEGEVTVDYDGGSVSFGAGDFVEFPKGLSCVWKVTKPVKKHYIFG
jgi:uncharacterized cupin superfamily protein